MFVLLGLPGNGKSTTIRRIADTMMDRGWNVELFHSPLNPDELDALIIPDLNTGIDDGLVCEGLPAAIGMETVYIDFENAVDKTLLSEKSRKEIEALQEQLLASYSKAYDSFASALRTHDEWEKFYIDNMDFRKADQAAEELIDSLFGRRITDKQAAVRHLFFGAATPAGAVDFIQPLTTGLEKRIFVKGRAGSGKSTLLKRLAAAAETRGFDVETFLCGFDPNSLDMLIFPQLSLAVFDSTAPHEYFPDRCGDETLDMYERAIAPGTDERYAIELEPIKLRYARTMKEAVSYLGEARDYDSRIKAIYKEATDFSLVDRLHNKLQHALNEIVINS